MDKFTQIIKNDIDMIAYYALKHKNNSNLNQNKNNAVRNLCFICNKFKLKFMVNTILLSQMIIVLLLNHINVQKLPKNVGIMLCNYHTKCLIRSKHNKNLQHDLIELILSLCEYDMRISKEPIEL